MSSAPGASNLTGYQNNTPHTFDTTGQVAPPGMKPRVTATLWEDEGSLCFQVEAKGVCVARREGMLSPFPPPGFSHIDLHADNHMINGTKLLNVAGMTRGRRDGILKSEKTRHVVKIGPMHLKGVW
jgi:protein SOK2